MATFYNPFVYTINSANMIYYSLVGFLYYLIYSTQLVINDLSSTIKLNISNIYNKLWYISLKLFVIKWYY